MSGRSPDLPLEVRAPQWHPGARCEDERTSSGILARVGVRSRQRRFLRDREEARWTLTVFDETCVRFTTNVLLWAEYDSSYSGGICQSVGLPRVDGRPRPAVCGKRKRSRTLTKSRRYLTDPPARRTETAVGTCGYAQRELGGPDRSRNRPHQVVSLKQPCQCPGCRIGAVVQGSFP
jgi:hypothetical protein